MRFVAGKGAVAELLLAWSRSGAVASRGAVTERHREDAGRGAVAAEMLLAGRCWPGRRGGAPSGSCCRLGRYSGVVAGWGAIAELLLAGDAMVELLLAGALQRSTARV